MGDRHGYHPSSCVQPDRPVRSIALDYICDMVLSYADRYAARLWCCTPCASMALLVPLCFCVHMLELRDMPCMFAFAAGSTGEFRHILSGPIRLSVGNSVPECPGARDRNRLSSFGFLSFPSRVRHGARPPGFLVLRNGATRRVFPLRHEGEQDECRAGQHPQLLVDPALRHAQHQQDLQKQFAHQDAQQVATVDQSERRFRWHRSVYRL